MKLFSMNKDHGIYPNGWKLDALQKSEFKITDKEKPFPCIPATQGFSLDHLIYGFVGDPREISTAQTLAILLKEYTQFFQCFGGYTSLIIFFRTPQDLVSGGSVEYFEKLFWEQLNILTTPMAKADGVLFRKHPTYNLPYEGAEVELLANNS